MCLDQVPQKEYVESHIPHQKCIRVPSDFGSYFLFFLFEEPINGGFRLREETS